MNNYIFIITFNWNGSLNLDDKVPATSRSPHPGLFLAMDFPGFISAVTALIFIIYFIEPSRIKRSSLVRWTPKPAFVQKILNAQSKVLVVFQKQGGESHRGILWWGRWKRGGGNGGWNSLGKLSSNLGSECQCATSLLPALEVPERGFFFSCTLTL